MLITLGRGLSPRGTHARIPAPIYENASPSVPGLLSGTGVGQTGTIFFRLTDNAVNTVTSDPVWITLSAGTSSTNRIFLQKRSTGSRLRLVSAATGQTNEIWDGYLSTLPSGTHDIAIAWGPSRFDVYINGQPLCYIPSSFVAPSGIDSIYLGRLNSGSSNNWSGSIAGFKLWNVQFTPAQLQALTFTPAILTGTSYHEDYFGIAGLGQSNMVGQASGSPSYTNTGKMHLLTNAMSLGSYADPWDDPASAKIGALTDTDYDVGCMGYLSDDLAGETGRDIAVVCATLSGTRIGSGAPPSWAVEQATYRTSGTKILGPAGALFGAVNQLQMAKQFFPLRVVLWGQGEGDAKDAVSESAYEAGYAALIDYIRKALNLPGLYWIDMAMPSWTSEIGATKNLYDAIIAAKQSVIASKIHAAYIDNTDQPGMPGETVHWGLAEMQIIGARASNAIRMAGLI